MKDYSIPIIYVQYFVKSLIFEENEEIIQPVITILKVAVALKREKYFLKVFRRICL